MYLCFCCVPEDIGKAAAYVEDQREEDELFGHGCFIAFFHIPPNYVVKPASFTIPLLLQDIPPMVCHELSRPHNLGVTHETRSHTHTRKPHHDRRFSG